MLMFGFDAYGGPAVTRMRQAAAPIQKPGHLVGDLVCASLNPADIKVRNGERIGKIPVQFPMAVGREACISLLEDSGHFRAGDLIFGGCSAGTGALAQQVSLDAAQACALPDGVTPQQAACIPVAIGTAWDAMHQLKVSSGELVVILGAGGGVGSHAIQLARSLGAIVIGVASASKHDIVVTAGGLHVESGPRWADGVRQIMPKDVDAIVDTVGGSVLKEAFQLVTDPARVISCAAPAAATEMGGSGVTRRRDAKVFHDLAAMIQNGTLRPRISAVYPLVDAAHALAEVESGHAAGKVLVTL